MSDSVRTQMFMEAPEAQEREPLSYLWHGWGWLLFTCAVPIPQVRKQMCNSLRWFLDTDPPWN